MQIFEKRCRKPEMINFESIRLFGQARRSADQFHELTHILIPGQILTHSLGFAVYRGKGAVLRPVTLLEDLGKLGHNDGSLEVRIGILKFIRKLARIEIPRRARSPGACPGPASAWRPWQSFRGLRVELDLIQGGDRMPCADLAGIHAVVAEILDRRWRGSRNRPGGSASPLQG